MIWKDVLLAVVSLIVAVPDGWWCRKLLATSHIEHRAAQLTLRMHLTADVDIPWIGHVWQEA